MGWNTGYTIFEATVVGAYDLGKLDKELLAVLMKPYRNSGIDSGGSCDLKAKDGLDVQQIVVKTMGLTMPPELRSDADDDAQEEYKSQIYELFKGITKDFGW